GTFNCGTNLVTGAGTFTLASGGTLGIGDPNGITAFDTSSTSGSIRASGRFFDPGANYNYTGSAPQVTGNGLPATINTLAIRDSSGVSLTSGVALTSTLTLTSGALSIA